MKIQILNPIHQALLAASLIVLLVLADTLFPHNDEFLDEGYSSWALATAVMLCFSLFNTILSLKFEKIITYWSRSALSLIALMVFSYAICYFISGKHIDEAGTFRWLWLVVIFTWLIFFTIARSMKRIVEIALKQDRDLHEN